MPGKFPGGSAYAIARGHVLRSWQDRALDRIRQGKSVLITTDIEDGGYPGSPKVLWDRWEELRDKLELGGLAPALEIAGENRTIDEVSKGKRYKREDYIIERAVQANFTTLSDYLDYVCRN